MYPVWMAAGVAVVVNHAGGCASPHASVQPCAVRDVATRIRHVCEALVRSSHATATLPSLPAVTYGQRISFEVFAIVERT